MLARIRQWRRQVKRSISLLQAEKVSERPEPAPQPPPLPSPIEPRSRSMREVLAWEYLKGDGLEVGALHQPLPLPPKARVRYVDRLHVEGLRNQYPELKELPLVHVDLIDDGEKLSTVPEGSQDFVVANHFIEHTQDPIGTIQRFLAVLKKGGVLLMVFPDKRGSNDRLRALTSLEHLYRDHEEGPQWSYEAHFHDYVQGVWALLAPHRTQVEIDTEVERLLAKNYSIHFHVWTHTTFWEMLVAIRDRYAMPFDIYTLFYNQSGSESMVVLAKT